MATIPAIKANLPIPGLPHHVTRRGNGRAQTFFGDRDHELYLEHLTRHCRAAHVSVWAWVLMPTHVHLILTPRDREGLRRALSRVHRPYAGRLHAACGGPAISGRAGSAA